jgi:hypothetical protein
MAIELETLNNEREILKKDFDNLTQRIAQVEKDLGTMKSNLNAVYGAIQQVDKLIKLSSGDTKMSPEKEKALNLATS